MSSATRRSGRQRAANTRLNDLPDSSPTQARSQATNKKRKASTNHAPPARRQRRTKASEPEPEAESNSEFEAEPEVDPEAADTEAEDDSEEEGDEEVQAKRIIDKILPVLDVRPTPIVAAEKYENTAIDDLYGNQNIECFAKVCGRDWTYHVVDPAITFGRESEDNRPGVGTSDALGEVHIDLGPSKHVSRNHAELYFNGSDWQIKVLGRNGVKVNDETVKKGEEKTLQSGDVIGIDGTQMIFHPANRKPVIHQIFLTRLWYHENGQQGAASDPNGAPQSIAPGSTDPHEPHPLGSQAAEKDQVLSAASATADTRSALLNERPVTPEMTPQKMAPSSGKKKSPRTQRGIVMESTEQIDYSLDSSKDLKPHCSYASMITWAIMSSPGESCSLNGIYDWIKKHYAYYRLVPSGWQNSIRHNLSLNPAFVKVPRQHDEPGKGMKWAIDPEKKEETLRLAEKNISKAGGHTSSTPGSPAGSGLLAGRFPQVHSKKSPSRTANQQSGLRGQSSFPASQPTPYFNGQPNASSSSHRPATSTPPQNGTANTVSHQQPQLPVYAPTQSQGSLPTFSDATSPYPRRQHHDSSVRLPTAAGDSSPVLNSYQGWSNYSDPTNLNGGVASTPAPRAHNLTVLQPNTVKLPTSHMIESSPAPFWKFPDGIGSTPAKHWEATSPRQGKKGLDGDSATGSADIGLQSSSPPPVIVNGTAAGPGILESPTRKGGSFTVNQRLSLGPSISNNQGPSNLRTDDTKLFLGNHLPKPEKEEDDQDEQIDLAKGFRGISSYHQQRNSATNSANNSFNASFINRAQSASTRPPSSNGTRSVSVGIGASATAGAVS